MVHGAQYKYRAPRGSDLGKFRFTLLGCNEKLVCFQNNQNGHISLWNTEDFFNTYISAEPVQTGTGHPNPDINVFNDASASYIVREDPEQIKMMKDASLQAYEQVTRPHVLDRNYANVYVGDIVWSEKGIGQAKVIGIANGEVHLKTILTGTHYSLSESAFKNSGWRKQKPQNTENKS